MIWSYESNIKYIVKSRYYLKITDVDKIIREINRNGTSGSETNEDNIIGSYDTLYSINNTNNSRNISNEEPNNNREK